MLEIYLSVFKNYFEFKGRARRKEYWVFILCSILVSVVLGLVDVTLGLYSEEAGLGLLSGLYALAIIIPSIALSVRRLHDTGRSGWWVLLSLIPLIGPIVLIVFYVMDSKPGENEYGPNPKEQLHHTVA
ncbi:MULTISPECIES: DUF805 domain-containing protein [Pseudoalteromonas]|uniref:DUF805 domain-containing protein n=1 Tax=Pseudoalteromonas TaxID=53246 RepID=UPI000F767A98|nr:MULTISPECIES: DUF805 domain-containing protein [Pseudoalteromonas]MCG7561594.1 DUF805 domain-containing protein [Pseudoalteromonas sp. McH1-42]MEC4089335.1 DUF805 domain-containing protein [Pseudoalteromonas rubra]